MFHSQRVQYWILTHAAGHETTTKGIGIPEPGIWLSVHHLVGGIPTPLKIWKSVGMIIPNNYMQKKIMFQTTNKENPFINDEKHTYAQSSSQHSLLISRAPITAIAAV